MKEEKENKLKREKRNQDIRKNIMVSGKTNIIVTSCLSVFTTVIALIFSRSLLITAVTLFSSIVLVQIYFAIKQILKEAERLKKMESSFQCDPFGAPAANSTKSPFFIPRRSSISIISRCA